MHRPILLLIMSTRLLVFSYLKYLAHAPTSLARWEIQNIFLEHFDHYKKLMLINGKIDQLFQHGKRGSKEVHNGKIIV